MEQDRQLSIKQRYLLTYIKYRTNNNHQFFAGNEVIAKAIGCNKNSTKVIVNKLIREGYILKTTDDRGRRILSLSGKEFLPLDGVNMSNTDKHILKQEIGDLEADVKYYRQQLIEAKQRISFLEQTIIQQNEIVQKYLVMTNNSAPEVTADDNAAEVTANGNEQEQTALPPAETAESTQIKPESGEVEAIFANLLRKVTEP